jgi:hypothetical protein
MRSSAVVVCAARLLLLLRRLDLCGELGSAALHTLEVRARL